MADLSPRLAAVLEALPLRVGLRVLEVGCGPGALARAMAVRVGATGYVLGVDRSPTAIQAAERVSDHGSLDFRVSAVRLAAATVPNASVYIDQGNPLKRIPLH